MLSGHRPMYDRLFGDMPMSDWPSDESRENREGEPWREFAAARTRWAAGDRAGAIAGWRSIAGAPGVQTRHRAQAWAFLRLAGEAPALGTPEGDLLLGVVVEETVGAGLDITAAYTDHRVFHLNHAGAAVTFEPPDQGIESGVDSLLELARGVVAKTGVWEQDRLGPAVGGLARVSMLTPAGLHFGQGPAAALARDPMAAPLLSAAKKLVRDLLEWERTR